MNLVQQAKDLFTSSFINDAARSLGETETGVKKGLDGIIPAIFSGLINRGNSHNGNVMDLITSGASLLDNDGGFNLGNIFASDNSSTLSKAGGLLSMLFGNKLNDITNGIGSFSGTKQSSITSLLTAAVPAIIGLISRYFRNNNITSEDKAIGFFNSQRDYVASATPAGLSLANFFGADRVERTTRVADEPVRTTTTTNYEEPVKKNNNWLMWLLLLALLGLALWFLLGKGCKKNDTTVVNDTDTTVTVVDRDTTVAVDNTRVEDDIDLNGVKLRGYRDGLESSMITYLKSGDYTNATDATLKEKWYNFDRVNFVHGSANKFEAGSEAQLDNLVAILKAYPDAKIKIGGYTDKTGDAAANKKLSQERADFIKKYLSDKGVGAQVTGAEGYGSEFATVPAEATDAERAVDRKMSVRFAK